jgi:hypothetical protein
MFQFTVPLIQLLPPLASLPHFCHTNHTGKPSGLIVTFSGANTMKRSTPFAAAIAMFAAISAAIAAGNPRLIGVDTNYRSRGKGEGLSHNKYAKSSFKQNKRRGL